jgi:hypothetical protein
VQRPNSELRMPPRNGIALLQGLLGLCEALLTPAALRRRPLHWHERMLNLLSVLMMVDRQEVTPAALRRRPLHWHERMLNLLSVLIMVDRQEVTYRATVPARSAVSECMRGSLPLPAMAPSQAVAAHALRTVCQAPPGTFFAQPLLPPPLPRHNSVRCRQLAARGQPLLPYIWALLDCHATPGVADGSLVEPLAQWTLINAVQVLLCLGEPVPQRQRQPAAAAVAAAGRAWLPRPAAAPAEKECWGLGQRGRSCVGWLLLVNRARWPR